MKIGILENLESLSFSTLDPECTSIENSFSRERMDFRLSHRSEFTIDFLKWMLARWLAGRLSGELAVGRPTDRSANWLADQLAARPAGYRTSITL